MDDIIWPGEPGSRWTNEGSEVAFQFFCSFVNSCPECMSLHTAISEDPWPIPVHDHCGCWQETVFPGADSDPFVHFDDYLKQLTDDEKERSIGTSVFKLIKKGIVSWGDVVTPDRIRTLAEVVKAKKLTVDQMVGAGVNRAVAARAFNLSKAEVNEIIKRHRDELTRIIQESSKWANALRAAVAAGAEGARWSGSGLPGWPGLAGVRPPRLPHTGLPMGDDDKAKLLDSYMKMWPNVPADYLWYIIENSQREFEKKHARR